MNTIATLFLLNASFGVSERGFRGGGWRGALGIGGGSGGRLLAKVVRLLQLFITGVDRWAIGHWPFAPLAHLATLTTPLLRLLLRQTLQRQILQVDTVIVYCQCSVNPSRINTRPVTNLIPCARKPVLTKNHKCLLKKWVTGLRFRELWSIRRLTLASVCAVWARAVTHPKGDRWPALPAPRPRTPTLLTAFGTAMLWYLARNVSRF